MSATLETDQEDIGARIAADPYFADIPVLVQRKGVTENDIEVALSVLNEKLGKIGACVIVLMPSLITPQGDSPGPEYVVRHAIQVIEQPLFSQDAGIGVGKSAEAIAEVVRKLIHFFASSGGTLAFNGMDPAPVEAGKISYIIFFRQGQRDDSFSRCGLPLITPDEGAVPQSVALSTATAGAAIWYTLDGSYPSSANPAAALYAAPIAVAAAATLRAAAQKTGLQQSNVAKATFTAA